MWQSLKIGTAIVAVVGLLMSGLAVAHAVDGPGVSDAERPRPDQVVMEALAPLLEDGTLTQTQAEAVASELAPLVARARFQDQTREMVKRLGRLAGEIAEVLGINPDDLGEQLEAGLTLAEIAAANGSTGEQLVAQVTDHIGAHLAVQVTAGKLDQERADETVAATAQTLGNLIDVEHPFGTLVKERRNRAVRAVGLDAAAEVLGLSFDELRAQLESGSSLAQIAAGRGIEESELIDAILTPVVAQIERAVERGGLSEEEAAERLGKATERVSEAIQKVPGA